MERIGLAEQRVQGTRRGARLAGKAALLLASLAACAGLTACDGFFQCAKSSCTTSNSGTATTSGNFAYVSNSASGSSSIAAYNIGSGALTAIAGSPFSLGYVPVAMKVSHNNAFLYVGSNAGGIYLYSVGSAGVLTKAANNPQILTSTGSISSMDISPDGAFLFVLDGTGSVLSEYGLNASTGALNGPTTFAVPGSSTGCLLSGSPLSQSCTVSASPLSSGSGYVAAALGTSGTVVFPYTTAGGITSASYGSIACCNNVVASPSGDFSLAFDGSNNLYIARTVALSSYSSVGSSSPVSQANLTFGSGVTPRSVTISNSSQYLYTANKGNGTISGFSLTGSGGLSVLAGSPYTAPASVAALGVDTTGNYLIAVGYNATSGVQLFKPSAGVPGTAVASAGTGTDTAVPALVALTH